MTKLVTLNIIPIGLALVALAVAYVGSGLSNGGLIIAWVGVIGATEIGLAVVKPSDDLRVFGGLAALALLFLLAYEGGWWLLPAVIADMILSARRAKSAKEA